MQKHRPLIYMLAICLTTPIAALITYKLGLHGSGYTNKGHLIKPMIVDKSLDKYLGFGKFSLVSIDLPEAKQKFSQIKRALGQKQYRINTINLEKCPRTLKALNKSGYKLFIADPRNNIILSYKSSDWQNKIYKDVLHLIKTSQ